jgi:hypothetical protein
MISKDVFGQYRLCMMYSFVAELAEMRATISRHGCGTRDKAGHGKLSGLSTRTSIVGMIGPIDDVLGKVAINR